MSNAFLTINKGSFLSQCMYLTEGETYKVIKFSGGNVVFYDDAGSIRLVSKNQVTLHYFPETLKVKQNIFTHPKWVTAKETDPEIGLVADRDYLVTKVEEDRYWVENPTQSNAPVWYKKERFYKVTPEDLLPPKKKNVEHIDEGFDGLVYVAPYIRLGKEGYVVIDTCKLSKDQQEFIKNNLEFYSEDALIGISIESDTFLNYCLADQMGWFMNTRDDTDIEISFNDIFKRV